MKCAVFLADGFEECEGLITVDMLRRADIETVMISVSGRKEINGSHGIIVHADQLYEDADISSFDVLILPGGRVGKENLESFEPLLSVLKNHFESGKLTCAICAAPSIFGHLGILKGKDYTCFPSFDEEAFAGQYQKQPAVKDGNLITGRGMGATIEFASLIIRELKGEETLEKVKYGMQYFA